jgi:hypothetical protein
MAQKLSQSVAKRQEFTETLVQPRPADLFSVRSDIASFGSAVWTNKRLNDGRVAWEEAVTLSVCANIL